MAPADGTNTRAATLSEVDLLRADNANLARKLAEAKRRYAFMEEEARIAIQHQLAEAERREGDWHAVADCRSEEIIQLRQQLAEAQAELKRYAGVSKTFAGDLKLRQQLAEARKWIINNPSNIPDHACVQCMPHSDMLVTGFVCAYHAALEASK